MPKKRTHPKSNIADHQMIQGSGSFQHVDDVKRAKLTSFSNTTLQDLPLELLECILIKAIVMEVKGMKLAKSVLKEKADLVIGRLRTVCSPWINILASNFFRNELHRALDNIEPIRLDILHRSLLVSPAWLVGWRFVSMKDEVFLMSMAPRDYRINVYDRNNMAVVKDVIALPRIDPRILLACSVSNCLYILNAKRKYNHFSILRIARDDETQFTISPLIGDVYLPRAGLCVSPNGSLMLSREQSKQIDAVTVYDAQGSLVHTVRLPSDKFTMFYDIVPKSNGNIVLVDSLFSYVTHQFNTELTEIDMNGVIIRHYQSQVHTFGSACVSDNAGRMLMSHHGDTTVMEVLDSEFNLMELSNPQLLSGDQLNSPMDVYCNRERNEMVAIETDPNSSTRYLTIFRLT